MCARAEEGPRGGEQRASCQERHTRSGAVGWGYRSNPHRTTAQLRPEGGGTGKTPSPGFEESRRRFQARPPGHHVTVNAAQRGGEKKKVKWRLPATKTACPTTEFRTCEVWKFRIWVVTVNRWLMNPPPPPSPPPCRYSGLFYLAVLAPHKCWWTGMRNVAAARLKCCCLLPHPNLIMGWILDLSDLHAVIINSKMHLKISSPDVWACIMPVSTSLPQTSTDYMPTLCPSNLGAFFITRSFLGHLLFLQLNLT